jgi:N-acyl-D-aspartate/D-glutamate deacylase
MKADLNVIDFDKLKRRTRPKMAFDLPAGGKRLLQGASGYVATIVSGEVVYRDGEATSALPGKRQTRAWSATRPGELIRRTQTIMTDAPGAAVGVTEQFGGREKEHAPAAAP